MHIVELLVSDWLWQGVVFTAHFVMNGACIFDILLCLHRANGAQVRIRHFCRRELVAPRQALLGQHLAAEAIRTRPVDQLLDWLGFERSLLRHDSKDLFTCDKLIKLSNGCLLLMLERLKLFDWSGFWYNADLSSEVFLRIALAHIDEADHEIGAGRHLSNRTQLIY